MAVYSGKGASSNGSVYVCNLPDGTDENMLSEHFGTIGLLKKDKRTGKPKIWIYRDKTTDEPKGDATITYEDPHAALAAVEWFNDKDFHGNTINVFMAETKALETNFTADNDDIPRDENKAPPVNAKAWKQEGDWLCPNTSCGNVNFAFRGVCNRCGTSRPASGGTGSFGRGKGRGGGDPGRVGAGSTGLFGPNDWPCPMCGNINWAKRTKCNICNTNKPGHNEGGVRGGRGGGYKELDEEELEDTKRRRRVTDEDDGEMYDEFGNLKKKFRAKNASDSLSVKAAGRAAWEDIGDDRDRRLRNDEWPNHRSRSRSRSPIRERERGKDRERERNR